MTTNADLNHTVDRWIDYLGDECHGFDLGDAETLIEKLRGRLDEVAMPEASGEPDEDEKLERHRVYEFVSVKALTTY